MGFVFTIWHVFWLAAVAAVVFALGKLKQALRRQVWKMANSRNHDKLTKL